MAIALSCEQGTAVLRSVNGILTTFYYNIYGSEIKRCGFYKADADGNYSQATLFTENNENVDIQYGGQRSMAVLPNGTIIVVISLYVPGGEGTSIKVRQSTDWGETWGSFITVVDTGSYGGEPRLELRKDSSGNLYIAIRYLGASRPFRMFKSVDNGLNWNEFSPPYTPNIYFNVLSMSISENRVYVIGTYVDYIDYVYVYNTYLWITDDGGETWTMETAPDDLRISRLAANGNTVVFTSRYKDSDSIFYLHRSIDAGHTWTLLGDRKNTWPAFIEPVPEFDELENDSDVFVLTSCISYVEGSPNLGYLISKDNGATWTPQSSFVPRIIEG